MTAGIECYTHFLEAALAKNQEKLRKVLEENPQLRSQLDSLCLNFLSTKDIDNLAELIEVVQNALANRVQITFREAERWNVTVDARGIGLDRIISAADAPLKCGLGILRRVMNHLINGELHGKSKEEINAENRKKIGGASKITYHPRSFSKRLIVGNISDVFLASIDLNIAHLTRPRAFYIHLHEVAHLISNLFRDVEDCTHPDYKCARAEKCCHKKVKFAKDPRNDIYLERYQEIFAEMLIHRFLFENDRQLFFRNYLANYSLDPVCYAGEDDETFVRMLEVLIRGFLASDPFRKPRAYSTENVRTLTREMRKDALDEFWKLIEDAGPFLFDFQRLWHGSKESEIKNYVNKEFLRVYEEAYHPVCCMWGDVNRVYNIVTEEIYPDPNDIKDSGKIKGLAKQIEDGFEMGRPLIRVQYKDRRPSRPRGEEGRLDPLFLISNLLVLHLDKLFGDVDTQENLLYLRRCTNGTPDAGFLPKGKNWNRRVLDRNFNGITAADPETRKRSMRNRIVIIKTLWDISTTLRARRMKHLLSSVWPKCFES